MASYFSRYPSIRSMSVSELLLHFRSSIDREALIALEERDGDWSRENDGLRAHVRMLDMESRELLLKTQSLEEELSKQTCMRKSLEEDIHRLAEKERWSERKIRALEMDVSDLRRVNNEELVRVRNEKADLEAKLQEFERQLANQKDVKRENEKGDFQHALKQVKLEKNDEIGRSLIDNTRAEKQRILRRIQVLEREKKELQAEVCNVKREKSDEMALEAEKRRSEEKEKMKVQELDRKIQVLEKEKGRIEAELCKTKSEKSTEIEMILKEKMTLEVQNRRIEEEMKEKISQLANKNEVLEMEKGEIEAELCQALNEKIALGGHKRRMEAELKEKISQLESIKKVQIALEVEKRRAEECVEVLEKGKTALEAEYSMYKKERRLATKQKNKLIKKITQEKTTLEDEKRKVEEESDEKVSELVKRTEVLVRERDDMEAELCKAKKHKINESERISKLKDALEDQKSRMEEAEKHVSEILKTIGVLEREKEAMDAKDEEKSEEIKRILKEKMDLEAEKRTMDDKHKKEVSELFQMIEVLKREKMEMEAEKRTMEDEHKRKVLELFEMIEVLKREKMEMESEKRTVEDEHKKKVLELFEMIEVLKRKKMEMGAKFCQANKENSEEIKRILKEKMDSEAEMRTLKAEDKKKILDLFHMIEVLKREKMEMKTKFYQASKVQNEEIKRILNENIAMKTEKKASEEDAKKISELADRIGILEMEKRGLEEEIVQKNEVIQVLAQENDSLEDMKKKLKMEIDGLASKLKKDVKLFQQVHHPSNVNMLRTPLQNEGQKSLGGCKRKRHLSEDLIGGRISGIGNANSHVSENLASCRRRKPTMWEVDQDLLDAFDGDPELCLEAICALYRQHKLLLSSKPTNSPLSLGVRGSKPDYSSKVIALAEYLIDEDPEGRMKKSVAELEQLDPVAVGECIDIAKQLYKQVFEIYKNKQDPFFLS